MLDVFTFLVVGGIMLAGINWILKNEDKNLW